MPPKGWKSISVHDEIYDNIAVKAKRERRTIPNYVEFHLGR